nr:MAG TPA: hypothetical protein [Siphoviridae sp. ct8TV20]
MSLKTMETQGRLKNFARFYIVTYFILHFL